MNVFLFHFFHSLIISQSSQTTIPLLFMTLSEFQLYNPNKIVYPPLLNFSDNYDHCFQSKSQLNDCIDSSLIQFFHPDCHILPTNDPWSFTKKCANPTKLDSIIIQFWKDCSERGNQKCSDIYSVFNFLKSDNNNFNFNENQDINTSESTIFKQLQYAHFLMYNNTSNLNETFEKREKRFKKVYEILRPIALAAFGKYSSDFFAFLRPLNRILHPSNRFNLTFVSHSLGKNRLYQNEEKLILDFNNKAQNLTWIYNDLIYPEVAKLLMNVLTKRNRKIEQPIPQILSELLQFEYLPFEKYKLNEKMESYEDLIKFISDNYPEVMKKKPGHKTDRFEEYDDDYEYEYLVELFSYESNKTDLNDNQNRIFVNKEDITERNEGLFTVLDSIINESFSHGVPIELIKSQIYSNAYLFNSSEKSLWARSTVSTLSAIISLHLNQYYFKSPNRTSKQFLTKIYNSYSTAYVEKELYDLHYAVLLQNERAAEVLLYELFNMLDQNTTESQQQIEYMYKYILTNGSYSYQVDPSLYHFCAYIDNSRQKTSLIPAVYLVCRNQSNPIISDLVDAIIFFDKQARYIFNVKSTQDFNVTFKVIPIEFKQIEPKDILFKDFLGDQPDPVLLDDNDNDFYINPRNWTYEDGAKALRRFIDSSILMQTGHYAEESLSQTLGINRIRYVPFPKFNFTWTNVSSVFDFLKSVSLFESLENDDNELCIMTANGPLIFKDMFLYALRIYQTLALSGNRDAMWNAQMLMKAIHKTSQSFIKFITDSNETTFLHELDPYHRDINETVIKKEPPKEAEFHVKDLVSPSFLAKQFLTYIDRSLNVITWGVHGNTFTSFFYPNDDGMKRNRIDVSFYETISDRDPYAAFSLAWKKRNNLTAAFELLNKVEELKPDAKIPVVISKILLTALSFFPRDIKNIFNFPAKDTNQTVLDCVVCTISNSPYYVKEILLGLSIMVCLGVLISIRIALYCN